MQYIYTHIHMHTLDLYSLYTLSTVQLLSRVWLCIPWTAAHQASLSITNSWACSNSCPSSWWYHLTISSSVVRFSSCLQFFPASESFLVTQFFTSGGQSIGASAWASVLSMNIQDWFPLGWTGWISSICTCICLCIHVYWTREKRKLCFSPTLLTWDCLWSPVGREGGWKMGELAIGRRSDCVQEDHHLGEWGRGDSLSSHFCIEPDSMLVPWGLTA